MARTYLMGRRRYPFQLLDQLVSVGFRAPKAIPTPRRLLISNIAHLGDLVIATSILPQLRELYPDCQFGLLINSCSRCVVEGHPLVSQIHTFDHYRLNRSPGRSWRQHHRSAQQALGAIKQMNYDCAIDLYPYYPNTIPLLWRAGIPVRAGYTSAGFGVLLTHPRDWHGQSMIREHFDLVQATFNSHPQPAAYYLPQPDQLLVQQVRASLPSQYLIVHMGSGDPIKEWPAPEWRQLLLELKQLNLPIVLTGHGANDERLIAQVTADLPNCLNRCNCWDWKQFLSAISAAHLVITADTVTGHVAEAYKVPTLVLLPDRTDAQIWKPPHAVGIRQSTAQIPEIMDQLRRLNR